MSNIFICINCKKSTHNPKFCSSSCSAIYNNKNRKHTDKTKAKIREFAINNPKGFAKSKLGGIPKKGKTYAECIEKICPSCNKKFETLKSVNKIFCCDECIVTGGYREKSGRGKSGHYKGIYCASTYELCWVIYQLDHNIPVKRFPTFLQNNEIKYYPDFLLPDNKTIIEIKGYDLNNTMDKKIALAKEKGFNIIVMYKEDLTNIFNYVETTYKTKKFETLYDL